MVRIKVLWPSKEVPDISFPILFCIDNNECKAGHVLMITMKVLGRGCPTLKMNLFSMSKAANK